MVILHHGLLYGAIAMSASVPALSYLRHRRKLQYPMERIVSSHNFLQTLVSMDLSPNEKIEMRRFWERICSKVALNTATGNSESGTASIESQSDRRNDARDTDSFQCYGVDTKVQLSDLIDYVQENRHCHSFKFPFESFLVCAEVAANLPYSNAWSGIVESTSSIILSTSKRFQEIANDTSGEMRQAVHRTVQKYLERALDLVGDRLKYSLKDPDMPAYLKANIDIAVDKVMPDIKYEVYRKTRLLFITKEEPILYTEETAEGAAEKISSGVYQHARATILYHLFPYNKSIWMSMKDRYWILFTSIGLLPMIGQIWWLLLFVIKDKKDEHLLCQFIIGFKTAQFFTLGIYATTVGVAAYMKCVIRGNLSLCQEHGPGLNTWGVFFFILQIGLVWAAFFRLPYTAGIPGVMKGQPDSSKQKHEVILEGSSTSQRVDSPSDCEVKSGEILFSTKRVYHDVFGKEIRLDRGGYLMQFCGYETLCLAVISFLSCTVIWYPFMPWQRRALFYWLRTAYGIVSFPFLIFKVPVVTAILLHTKRMGYDQNGRTVPMVTPANRD